MHLINWLRRSLLIIHNKTVILILVCWLSVPRSSFAQENGRQLSSSPPIGASPQETIKYGSDALEYSFQPNQPLQADNQRTIPLSFRITLPLYPIAKYKFGIDAFGFRYDQHQTVYIYLDYIQPAQSDTTYQVKDKLEIDELLSDKLSLINDADQLNIEANPFLQERKTYICKKGRATILLYNITASQSKKFLHSATSFNFLSKS